MKSDVLRRVGPALAAFVLVALGVMMLGRGSSSQADTNEKVATVVAIAPIEAGTKVSDLGNKVETRLLSSDARAQGAVQTVNELGTGVLNVNVVPGQQLLPTMLAADVYEDLGRGRVAVSAKLDAAQWAGPVATTGQFVNVYAIGGANADLIASNVVVISAPDPNALTPQQEAIITLGVNINDVPRVIGAVSGAGIWLVTA